MLVHPIIPASAALLGLLFGSFLNVVIARVPYDESIVSPRSRCPSCRAQLRWYDNIPLLSFLFLRGRCRSCDAAISWRYPAVELTTAAWLAISFLPLAHPLPQSSDSVLQLVIGCLASAALGCLLIALAVIDWRHHVLPNVLTYGGILTGLLFACTTALFLNDNQADVVLQHPIHINSANAGRSTGNIFLTGPEHVIFGRVFAAIGAFLLLYLVGAAYKVIRRRDGMGLGDAKLLAMIAAFLGLAPTMVALALGICLATMYALVLLMRRTADGSTRLPFGSFLAAAGLVAAVYGQTLAERYLSLFR